MGPRPEARNDRGSTVRQEGTNDTFDSRAIPTPACNRIKKILTSILRRDFTVANPKDKDHLSPTGGLLGTW